MVNFCASLTTIPSRIREVSLTIDSLINQTKKPEKIFLNIPYKYERFPEQVISTEQLEKLRNYENLEIFDRVGGGDSFASGMIYGALQGFKLQKCLDYGLAHGALAMTTPGDTSMATLAEVKKLAEGGSARVQR